ncbi:1-deoxy-D-xylulose-5-phosphate reductoisomerase [Hydrogenobacter hydrogenophilus]|uniref:1-deoxy-D-xylulose 5-phosphate reductoisomerase n=1 Tax=Hydrogenobacter hydrogenophilus TaxID=35835 RepID=A0A285P5M9_9AQUI|nr:1-deoxy-D-xylulose-5-phosphate reductoisomerase [Hydrogenobacter hydrogenophilus]SNZ16473.1 1-deoxy-D-xylulose 5-phosphate reductoisomerase [Hydrogenobacter hydrogenophilus]
MRKLGVLGSTGSVGSQTLDIVRAYREEFHLVGIVAKKASEKLLKQAIEFKPHYVVSYEEPSKDWLNSLPKETTYIKGQDGLIEVISASDFLMNAISGIDGIIPTYEILRRNKRLLASNKESIVCLGDLIREKRDLVVPVDSEHNALFQLLSFVSAEDLRKVYLTASGGPFRERSLQDLEKATVDEALNHPRWKMGAKITVDSATLMNKGMEIIEAINLFDLSVDSIDVLIHPQSVVHGIVELKDGSFLFHVSQTDMKIPIMHALFYPDRKDYPFERKSLLDLSPISFEQVDREKFRALHLCKWSAQMGGAYIPALVGADQAAVEMFLEGHIKFLDIVRIVEDVLSMLSLPEPQNIEQVLNTINWAYQKGKEVSLKYA